MSKTGPSLAGTGGGGTGRSSGGASDGGTSGTESARGVEVTEAEISSLRRQVKAATQVGRGGGGHCISGGSIVID